MDKRLRLITTCAMLAAMTTIATMVIKVPTFGTNGYVNIGDALVIVSAWMMGNPYGALAAGIGSALADLLLGYGSYAPATAVIKFAMAFVFAIIYRSMSKNHIPGFIASVTASIVAEVIMVAGYFLYESTVMGYGIAASASVISNAIQGIVCIVLGNSLVQVLSRVPKLRIWVGS